MALIDTIKSLFGTKTNSDSSNAGQDAKPEGRAEDNVEYKNCLIIPTPIKEGSQYRTAGTISSQSEDPARETHFIRADNHSTREQAVEHSVGKARQIIDERGSRLFDSERC